MGGNWGVIGGGNWGQSTLSPRYELPQLAAWAGKAEPDGFGDYTVLEAPWASNQDRCRLAVEYRGDCFEIAVHIKETRGQPNGRSSAAILAAAKFDSLLLPQRAAGVKACRAAGGQEAGRKGRRSKNGGRRHQAYRIIGRQLEERRSQNLA